MNYVAKNLKIDLFARNKDGETALSICQSLKNKEGEDILTKYSNEYDNSKNLAEDLLNQLEKEEA